MIKTQITPVKIVKRMQDDSRYLRLLDTFNTHENFRLPVEDLLLELKQAHRSRKVRKLNPTDPKFVDKLIAANVEEIAKRSRLTEILIRCGRAHSLLQSSVESLRYHLLSTYSAELRSIRTKEERLQIVNKALRQFEAFLVNVAVLRESAQLVIADIDKAAWSLKLTVQAVELSMAYEKRI